MLSEISSTDNFYRCDSTEITIKAHVMHMYANLPESLYDQVTLNIGTCEGTQAPDANGWVEETFNLGDCGGEMSQSFDNIFVSWKGEGVGEPIQQDGIYITSLLEFNAQCTYSSDVSLTAATIAVDQIVTDVEEVKAEGKFDKHFQMQIYSDPSNETKAENVNIGWLY